MASAPERAARARTVAEAGDAVISHGTLLKAPRLAGKLSTPPQARRHGPRREGNRLPGR